MKRNPLGHGPFRPKTGHPIISIIGTTKNIVFIMAMTSPVQSKLKSPKNLASPTPRLNPLASEGMRFTDYDVDANGFCKPLEFITG